MRKPGHGRHAASLLARFQLLLFSSPVKVDFRFQFSAHFSGVRAKGSGVINDRQNESTSRFRPEVA